MFLVDMHTHTTKISPDSSISPQDMILEAKRIGLDAVCFTEHGRGWDQQELDELAKKYDFTVFRGIEITSDLGHILVFGVNGPVGAFQKAKDLRQAVKQAGGFMILAHPFYRAFDRRFPNSFQQAALPPPPRTPNEAANLPVFELVDEMEVINAGCSDYENFFAYQVARQLGMRGTGSSDAHSEHGLGRNVTVFPRAMKSVGELMEELRAGNFYAATGLLEGDLSHYADELFDPDLNISDLNFPIR